MFHTNCEKLGKEDQWGSPPGTGTALWLCTKVRYSKPPGVSTRRGETEKAEALAKSHAQEEDRTQKTKRVTAHTQRGKSIVFRRVGFLGSLSK